MRRTKIQREEHQRRAEELMVRCEPPRKIVRKLCEELKLTPRQVRYDVKQVQERVEREDYRLQRPEEIDRRLGVAVDRQAEAMRKALEKKDARRARPARPQPAAGPARARPPRAAARIVRGTRAHGR